MITNFDIAFAQCQLFWSWQIRIKKNVTGIPEVKVPFLIHEDKIILCAYLAHMLLTKINVIIINI